MARPLLFTIFATFALFTTLTYAVSPLKVQGSEYVNAVNGDRFQIIGVAYVHTFYLYFEGMTRPTFPIASAADFFSQGSPSSNVGDAPIQWLSMAVSC
jgi:hypothetical protein